MRENDVDEMVLRPLWRWLDRNMESIFTEGLLRTKLAIANQSSGLVFVRNEKTAEEQGEDEENGEEEELEDEKEQQEDEEEVEEEDEVYDSGGDFSGDEDPVDILCADVEGFNLEDGDKLVNISEATNLTSTQLNQTSTMAPVRKGTEVKFVNMELAENVSLMRSVGLALVLQCSRCKLKTEVSLGPNKSQSKSCEKCRISTTVQFRPAIVHRYSPVIGFLDIFGSIPTDVVTTNSKFSFECFGCSKGQSPIGLHAGKSGNSIFCSTCHTKLWVAFSSVKFTTLVANDAFTPKDVAIVKQAKKQAPPGIREGRPLPSSGACLHYKKSFRWLRFSCCGRVFPCDGCHEEEIKDHEPDFAPRMICGHCSKEQAFTKDKPCISCGESTTRARTAHWEGGKGCRNKTKMASTDKQKFRNCSKTVSRKAQEKLDAVKPGNDKKVM